MEKYLNIEIQLNLKPSEVYSPLLGCLKDKYNGQLFKKFYIVDVMKINETNGGRILNDGSILCKITAYCIVLDPEIGNTYNLKITNINKMGALYKHELVTIFIPTQYYNNHTLEVDSTFDITIIGKRIEDSIVCVGKVC